MARIKIDPEMLDIYMELLNKLMAGSRNGRRQCQTGSIRRRKDGGWTGTI